MKKYLNQNVYDALIERLHFLFNEFPIVYISFSQVEKIVGYFLIFYWILEINIIRIEK